MRPLRQLLRRVPGGVAVVVAVGFAAAAAMRASALVMLGLAACLGVAIVIAAAGWYVGSMTWRDPVYDDDMAAAVRDRIPGS